MVPTNRRPLQINIFYLLFGMACSVLLSRSYSNFNSHIDLFIQCVRSHDLFTRCEQFPCSYCRDRNRFEQFADLLRIQLTTRTYTGILGSSRTRLLLHLVTHFLYVYFVISFIHLSLPSFCVSIYFSSRLFINFFYVYFVSLLNIFLYLRLC
jgi:hypothetical protein